MFEYKQNINDLIERNRNIKSKKLFFATTFVDNINLKQNEINSSIAHFF